MTDLKSAVKNAKEFANMITNRSLSNVEVEEIDLDEYEDYYLITLSWDDKPIPLSALETAAGIPKRVSKVYKTFYVAFDSGEVKKMKDCE